MHGVPHNVSVLSKSKQRSISEDWSVRVLSYTIFMMIYNQPSLFKYAKSVKVFSRRLGCVKGQGHVFLAMSLFPVNQCCLNHCLYLSFLTGGCKADTAKLCNFVGM